MSNLFGGIGSLSNMANSTVASNSILVANSVGTNWTSASTSGPETAYYGGMPMQEIKTANKITAKEACEIVVTTEKYYEDTMGIIYNCIKNNATRGSFDCFIDTKQFKTSFDWRIAHQLRQEGYIVIQKEEQGIKGIEIRWNNHGYLSP